MYKHHIISTKNQILTSGFRPPDRPAHSGCDYVDRDRKEITPRGIDIISIADGEVTRISRDATSGNFIYIRHTASIESFYCHLRDNSIPVKVGDKIKKEQLIGIMGKTGNVISSRTDIPEEYRGTHIHFGIRVNNEWVNPEPYLRGEKNIIGGTSAVAPQPVPNVPSQANAEIAVGDKVRVVRAIQYNGAPFKAWYDRYDVIQISGDRGVIGIGKIVTAAVNIRDLEKI